MNAFTIAGLVGIGVILFGILIALTMMWLSRLVTGNQLALSTEQTSYNPALTLGHKIPINADPEEQLQAARREAARRAAAQPRWSNARVGSLGASTLQPASENLEEDPLTAVRIAQFHTWQGARTGIPAAAAVTAAPAVAAATAPAVVAKSPDDLKPGVDYPFIEITDDMPADEKRKATIANAKARSAAVKALKDAGGAVAAPGAAPATAAAVVQAAPVVSVPEPQYIEITDAMSPEDVRKARIANAKTKSAYQKALKEAQEAAPVVAAAPAIQAQPAAAAAAAVVAPVASIPEPDYIEVTDSMSPDEVRRARITNAKLKSAYQKALKEAGVSETAAPVAAAAAMPAAQAAPVQATVAPAAATVAPAMPAIPKPDIIEITDDMSPDDVRRARIANAKAKSAYTKALKEAGIDPATVNLD